MIKIRSVVKKYELNKDNIITALDNISIDIKEGELVVFKGASGSGKSSILSLIAALSKPTSGEIIVDSKRVSKLPDNFASDFRLENIGFIFQKYNLLTNLTVKENIILPLVPLNLCADDIEKKATKVLQMFHIEHKKDVLVKNLSGGEQQRVAIARANVNDPKIILADEPTANLDEQLSFAFIEILKELKAQGKTIIVATHDPLFFNLDLVDREIEIHKGILL